MSWFTQDFLTFFDELKKNNNRDWFHENKKLYETAVKEPFAELVEDLIYRISGEEPGFDITPKDAIFRINRDVRFSKNKEPYKTHVAANISPTGRKSDAGPGFYIHFSSDEAYVGGGLYMPDKELLDTIRQTIAADPEALDVVLAEKNFRAKYGELLGEKNKVLPSGYKAVVARQPLIANKQFYYMADLKPDFILADDLPEQLMEYYHAGRGINEYLNNAIGTV